MNFRLKLATWFALSVAVLVSVLIFTAHHHLEEELRKDRWDRSHPKFPEWVIHGSYTEEEVHDILGELLHVWLWISIPLVLLSVAIGYFIALRSLRPIRLINEELAHLHPTSIGGGVSVPERDLELATLVEHLNDLLTRVHNSYAEMAEFSARVAHELRTPITLLRMRVEEAASDLPPRFSEELQEEIRRLSQLVERSILTAKAEGKKLEMRIENFALNSLLEDLRESYALLAEERSIQMEWEVMPKLYCESDGDLLRQILHNLLGNAIRYGHHRIRLRARLESGRKNILIQIANNLSPKTEVSGGVGIGLRLVSTLCVALPHTTFRKRASRDAFCVLVRLPISALHQTQGT